jgi:hypothetical protein
MTPQALLVAVTVKAQVYNPGGKLVVNEQPLPLVNGYGDGG